MNKKKFLCNLALLVLISVLFSGCQTSNTYISDGFEQLNLKANVDEYELPLSQYKGFASDLTVIDHKKSNTANMNKIAAPCGLLVNATKKDVILSKAAFTKTYPASTTKVMTALLALEYGNMDEYRFLEDLERFDIANAVICDYRNGDEISFETALHGALLHSGNDAAIVLSKFVNEDMNAFVELMNLKAQELGATQTHFANPHGLHDALHYTTAYDLYLIFQEAIKNPTFRNVIHKTTYSSTYTRKTDYNTYRINVKYQTTNQFLLNNYAVPMDITLVGGKSGYTTEAGYNYIMLFTYKNEDYIMVVMGSKTKEQLYLDMQNMMQLVSDAPLKIISEEDESNSSYSDHE